MEKKITTYKKPPDSFLKKYLMNVDQTSIILSDVGFKEYTILTKLTWCEVDYCDFRRGLEEDPEEEYDFIHVFSPDGTEFWEPFHDALKIIRALGVKEIEEVSFFSAGKDKPLAIKFLSKWYFVLAPVIR